MAMRAVCRPLTQVEKNRRHRERQRTLIAVQARRLADCAVALDMIANDTTKVRTLAQAREIAAWVLADARG